MRCRFVLLVFMILVMISVPSCKGTPSSPEFGVDRAHPLVRMVDFTLARISDNSAVTRSADDVAQIGFGTVAGPTYQEQGRMDPLVYMSGPSYVVKFDTTVSVPDSSFTAMIRIRIYFKSGAPLDIDTVLVTYHYPYSSAEVVLLPSDLPYMGPVQDMAFYDDVMYILPLGDSNLFRLFPGTHLVQHYKLIDESDFLAGDSCYIFIDNGMNLSRLNVISGSVDLNLRHIPGGDLRGIAAELGKVYVIYPEGDLLVFDRAGNVLDSVATNAYSVFHCAINSGVLYGFDYIRDRIYRYDTGSHADLSYLKAPARNVEGMEIYHGWLYYGDYTRRTVMRVPLSDLMES